jgi:hypothetical protein
MSDTKLELTEGAIQTIGRMEQRVCEIGLHYGESSADYLKALRSLQLCLAQLLRLGGRVTLDGDLGLYSISFIHFGIVFHSTYRDGERDPMCGEWSCHS